MKIITDKIAILISALVQVFIFTQCADSKPDTLIQQSFGDLFQLKRSETGELMTVSAIATDSENIYLYDMADRSLASFGADGQFLRKIKLQSIGRGEYVGDDFVVRNKEAIFLNSVDTRLEFFDLEKGLFRKNIGFPKEIPLQGNQRRYQLINRIFIDNSKLWVGNSHAVFPIDENTLLQKVTSAQVKKFLSGGLLLIYDDKNPVFYRSGKIEWQKKNVMFISPKHTLPGKQFTIFREKLYTCTVTVSGFTVVSTELTGSQ
jgi:hypothetical protein